MEVFKYLKHVFIQVTARPQFGQFPSYNLASAIGQSSTFNQQSVFVQPPPSAHPSELYSPQITQFRVQVRYFILLH